MASGSGLSSGFGSGFGLGLGLGRLVTSRTNDDVARLTTRKPCGAGYRSMKKDMVADRIGDRN